MKKLLSLLLVTCFVFAVAINLNSCASKTAKEDAPSTEDVLKDVGEEAPATETAPAPEPATEETPAK